MSKDEVIPVHSESWNNRELMERILSRYCIVIEDIGGRSPTYLISEKENDDIHDVLKSINQHLSPLGYSARLYPDDPWILQLIPDPIMQWPSPRFVLTMWILSMLTTVYAGEKWMSDARPSGGWFVENAALDALIGYTIPLFGVLIIASFIQKYIASKNGVNIPHIFPIPGPAILWWPFGILGFASLPRSDARLWPDRSSMGNTALSVPLIMIISGMVLCFIGLKLTPDVVPLGSSPLIVELPLLMNLIGISVEGETMMALKTAWAHPFTRVGMTLTFIGWISLLPIPTLPGGRILIARMGILEARSGSTQVMLLMVILLFAFLFGAFSEWSIWVPVVALVASLLITKGNDPRLPVVLDDFKGLPDKDHRRLGVILFMAFMFALPSQIPFTESEIWDDEISWSLEEDYLVIEDGSFTQILEVNNPSLIVQDWEVSLQSGSYGDYYLSSVDCGSGIESSEISCSGKVDPLDSIEITFNFEWNESWNTTAIDFIWNLGDELIKNQVIPDQEIYPVGFWNFNGDLDDPESCIDIEVEESDTVKLASINDYTSWDNVDSDGNISLVEDSSEICLNGLSGDDMSWLSDELFYLGNVSYKADYQSENFVTIPETGVVLDSDELMFSQSVLALNHDGDCSSMGTPSAPKDNTWNMSIYPVQMNKYEDSNESILLLAPAGGVITDCESEYSPERYTVLDGPALILGEGGDRSQHWLGSFEIEDGQFIIENPSSVNISIDIEFEIFGNGSQWTISNNIVLLANQTTTISAIAPVSGVSFSWFELTDDGDVILHLVNHGV